MTDADHPLLPHLDRLERVLHSLAVRKRLSDEDAEEFAAHVRLKLWQDGGDVIRQFQGRSSWTTYLTTVVMRLFLDYRRAEWGRWRPSAAATRLGDTAVRLERLLHRDQIAFEQAAELLRRNHGVEMSVAELASLAGKLPPPSPDARRPQQPAEGVNLERLAVVAAPHDPVEEEERATAARRAMLALEETLSTLDTDDRFLLRSLTGGLTVAEVSRMLGQEQKPLYRRRERLLKDLRRQLAERGLTAEDAADILAAEGCR